MRVSHLIQLSLILTAAGIPGTTASAQSYPDFSKVRPSTKPIMLVTWSAPGAVRLPDSEGWKLEHLTVYDNGDRPVAQVNSERLQVTASFIIFKNLSGRPNAEGCRDDVVGPLVKRFGSSLSQRKDGQSNGADGKSYPSTSYLLAVGDTKAKQLNTFAFAGDADTCAEIHVSTVQQGTPAEAAIQIALTEFSPTFGYEPTANDLFVMATMLFKDSPETAAPYYGESLKMIPIRSETLTSRRIVNDQLVMSLGMSNHLDASRHFAAEAIKIDPDYPLNYYNLACADAEEGKVDAAKVHLQQAFDRKANTIPGEPLPDPIQDDSIRKLKKDKAFWAFVQTLK